MRMEIILENKDFFNYCRNTLHKDFFIVPEYNNVKIKEFKETKLEKVKIYFETDNYNVLQITFDVNNLENSKVNLFPYFNGEICKSVDSIILIQEKNTENYYLFHIELKSQKPDDTEIFKKYISSIKMLNFIFEVLYLKYREKSIYFKFN